MSRWVAITDDRINVRNHGATGDGITDDTAAIQAAVTALPADGGTLYFPPGTYVMSSSLELGDRLGVKVVGGGKPGQASTVANGATLIKYTGSGWALRWAVGSGGALFNGVHIESIHIQGTPSAAGGIWLGNSSNSVIRDVTVSDFMRTDKTGTCFKIGDVGTSGAQYNTLDNVTAGVCDIGVDILNANGTRILGGLLEDVMPTPRSATFGMKIRADADTTAVVGTVIQGFDTLIDVAGTGSSFLGVRLEGFITAGYNIDGEKISVFGGSINNSFNGSVGTGILLTSNTLACMVMTPVVSSVATKLSDAGSRNTYIADPDELAKIEATVTMLRAMGLRVNKQGAGAQDPTLTMESNGTVGPTIGTADSFVTMIVDHAWANATRLSLRLRGTEALAVGAANTLGFHGATPNAKPSITGSRGGNAALASLLAALAAKGLVTDSTTA